MDTATNTPARRRGPKLPELALTDEERTTLQRRARRAKSSQALALRCRIPIPSTPEWAALPNDE